MITENKHIAEQKNTENGLWVTGAEAVIMSLVAEGVDTLFGYPGGAIMPIYDALYEYTHVVKHVLTRHEQGAVHAAQGYARASKKTGVCFATSGPGATNLITGIADAQIDSTPLVCITGQVSSAFLGTDAFQETDIIGISMPVTKWNFQVTKASEIPETIAKAFYIARSGRPGPVLVDITKDAQFEQFTYNYTKRTQINSYTPIPILKTEKVLQAAELINNAKKPLLVFGQGILLSGAEEELLQFINKTGVPAAWTILGISALQSGHALGVGMLGMHGNYAPNKLTNECDVLIAVGMRFDDRVTGNMSKYAKQATIIHIDIDEAEIDKNILCHVPIVADAKAALQLLTQHVANNKHNEWVHKFRTLEKEEHEKVIEKEMHPATADITMAEVMAAVNKATDGKAIIVTDVGQHQMIACRYVEFKQSRSFITSGGLGTMGFCLPAAIGAKIGAPERTVIAMIGDGGFQMTVQELGVILQEQTDVKILILNNNFLGMVRQWQELFFEKRYSFTEMTNPNFQTIASAYSIKSDKITVRAELQMKIEKFVNEKGAFLMEVIVGKENNVFPMVPAGASVSEIRLS